MDEPHPYITDFFSLFEISGKDAFVFLNNLITIDPSTLTLNKGSKTLILNPKGDIFFVLWVFRTPQSFLLLIPRSASSALETFLNERVFLEEVTIATLDTHGQMQYYPYPPHHGGEHDSLVSNDIPSAVAEEGAEEREVYIPSISNLKLEDKIAINGNKSIPSGWRFFLRLSGDNDCLEYVHQPTEKDELSTIHQKTISNQRLSALILQGGNGLYLLHNIITEQETSTAKPIISAIAIPNLAEYINYHKGCYPGQEIIIRSHTRKQTAVHWLVGIIPSNKLAHDLLQKQITQNQPHSDFESPYFINVKAQNIKLLTEQKTIGTLSAIARLIPLSPLRPLGTNVTTSIALAVIHRDYALDGNTFSIIDSEGKHCNFMVTHGNMIAEKSYPNSNSNPNGGMGNESFDSIMALGLQAYHQENNNNFSIAEQHFQTALTLNPSHPDPWEALAVIKEKQGNYDEAIRLNEKFAKHSTNSPLPYTNLSRLYMLKGQIERAEEEKQKATILMFRQAAQAKKAAPSEESASTSKNSSLSTKPSSPQDELNKERTRKKIMFKEVLKLDLKDEIANFGLGKILFEEQSYQEAIPHLEQTILTNPNFSLAYAFLGKAFLKVGAFDSAKDVLTRGINCAKKQGEMLPLKAMEEAMGDMGEQATKNSEPPA